MKYQTAVKEKFVKLSGELFLAGEKRLKVQLVAFSAIMIIFLLVGFELAGHH